jgi:hypothetical protein
MTYQLTFVTNTDYCQIKPSDTNCQYRVTIKADSKYEAVWEYLSAWRQSTALKGAYLPDTFKPILWTVKEME